jgi:hypothetical protein
MNRAICALLAVLVAAAQASARDSLVAVHGGGRSALASCPSKTKQGPLQLFAGTIMEARRHLAAAAVARSTSIFAMYPVDTVKASVFTSLAVFCAGVDLSLLLFVIACGDSHTFLLTQQARFLFFRRECKWNKPILFD